MLRKLLDFFRGDPNEPGAAPIGQPDEHPVPVPVAPPTTPYPPAVDVDLNPAREEQREEQERAE